MIRAVAHGNGKAHLVTVQFGWCNGTVGPPYHGAERPMTMAVVEAVIPPRLGLVLGFQQGSAGSG
jgi:hypothetical protein